MGLQDLDDAFDKTKPKEGQERTAVPEGQYQAKVFAVDVKQTRTPPVRDMLVLEFEIQNGKAAKRRVWKNCMLTQDNLEWLKADLFALGWAHKVSDLENPQKRASLLDKVVNITVKHKGEYKGQPNIQVYINSSIGGAKDLKGAGTMRANPAAAARPASAPVSDGSDDPPF